MKKKTFAVIGLGKFGYAVAETLAKAGYEVLAVDGDNERIQAIAPYASYPLCADVTEPGVMESLDFSNVDVAVIGISDHMEASIIGGRSVLCSCQGQRYASRAYSKENRCRRGYFSVI